MFIHVSENKHAAFCLTLLCVYLIVQVRQQILKGGSLLEQKGVWWQDSSVSSRKVDMTIRVTVDKSWTDEICVFECKSTLCVMVVGGAWEGEVAVFEGEPQVSDRTQQEKSVHLNVAIRVNVAVHLNVAILSDLEDLGLDTNKTYLVVAETRALAVDYYTL